MRACVRVCGWMGVSVWEDGGGGGVFVNIISAIKMFSILFLLSLIIFRAIVIVMIMMVFLVVCF